MTRSTVKTADDERISDTVIDAVAAATGTDPLELQPLYGTVDPDMLDRLFRCDGDGNRQFEGRVEFAFAGCDVSVDTNSRVVAVPSGEECKSRAPRTE